MNLRKPVQIFFVLFIIVQSVVAFPQTDSMHWNYIRKWSAKAIAEMQYSKIPASITMAQALHESRYGTSELAVNANNHFGIKCQTGWSGRTYTYQDDDHNTCFRSYDSANDSYRDHSNFLMTRPRYAALFEMDPHDYVAWAHGLKKAGYATNPKYAPILIRLVEEYHLYLLDTMQPRVEAMDGISDNLIPNNVREAVATGPKAFHRNRIDFIIAQPGDNIKSLTEDYNLLNWQIRKYNDIPRDQDVEPGQLLYIQPKRTHAEAGYSFHSAEPGESMYTIAQMYGVKLKCLYRRNHMKPGTQPEAGQEIWLRGKKR